MTDYTNYRARVDHMGSMFFAFHHLTYNLRKAIDEAKELNDDEFTVEKLADALIAAIEESASTLHESTVKLSKALEDNSS